MSLIVVSAVSGEHDRQTSEGRRDMTAMTDKIDQSVARDQIHYDQRNGP